MSIDELKLILGMVANVSDDAKTVAIVWVVVGALKSIASWGALAALVVFTVRSITGAVGRETRAQSAVAEINELLGQPGTSCVYYASEYRAVVAAVRKLKDRHD